MKIRSITYFVSLTSPCQTGLLAAAGEFLRVARTAFEAGGYEVQTVRLASQPFPGIVPTLHEAKLLQLAQELEARATEANIDYLSLGPALPENMASYALVPRILANTTRVFLSGMLTTPHGGISLPAIQACGEIIQAAAPLEDNGFANLRFAALANVTAGAPFFPAAYHTGGAPAFSLACEAADLAIEAFGQAKSLASARQGLVTRLQQHAQALTQIALPLAQQYQLSFNGLDLTPAPFPEAERSLGTALESLGLSGLGKHGSLAAAAVLADTLDQASFQRCGFNGLMLPVLEDAILSQRAAEGCLTLKDLLLYSSVCGTGLDTVPLPGSATAQQLSAVLLDLAALAQRLNKPLTARLMPIPGKQAGDPTGFDFAYFANSRVMALEADPLRGMFTGDENFDLQPRQTIT